MTVKGKTNHYNVKFLKGYGFSIKVKDSKIVLKNCYDPFKEPGGRRMVCQQYAV
jgi:CRISPR-associated protein Cas1